VALQCIQIEVIVLKSSPIEWSMPCSLEWLANRKSERFAPNRELAGRSGQTNTRKSEDRSAREKTKQIRRFDPIREHLPDRL